MTSPERVAVIGSGVAGLTAAYVASRTAHVTLLEADDRLGGHADTHLVREGDRELAIDTGFIVHNNRTYPTLLRLFAELGVATQESDMSMSVRSDDAGLEYAGALGLTGLFPTTANLRNPAYLRMLQEIPRFHRMARALLALAEDRTTADETFGEFLERGRFTPYFRRHFGEALVAAVWSCDPAIALDYPARYLFEFLQHHGMLRIFGSPQWRTVTGGSREYVARVVAQLGEVRTSTKVTSVFETPDGVEVTDGNGGTTTYDAVVVATHPGQALAMLADPTPLQRELLAAIPYTPNTALLHTDTSVLPNARRAWASWNHLERLDAPGVTITYDLTRLMRLPTDTHYLVSLGAEDLVDPALVIDRMEYEHPVYNPTSVAAQRRLPEIGTDRVAFAGAWHGWGFHEDGARSGAAAAERLGLAWTSPSGTGSIPALPTEARSYTTSIRHVRRSPMRREFTYRSRMWVVDADRLPDHGVLGRFEARDHLGRPDRTIRENVEAFVATEGVELAGGRILMAANARAFGYNFNPISVFWCLDDQDRQVATVVEVHNTYGDRHAYLVHPDERGRATVPKQMYVSPFHGTDGVYDLVVPLPTDRLLVSVRLTTDHGEVFSASMTGRQAPGGVARSAPAAALGALRIRRQGLALWARGLKIRPRPTHPRQEAVQ
ncbi:FAD-dependent oxidoreductase [Nocardioides sp.]|uniref:FAD-dependent oxidoreductase n=1 Tax=Nocardioides sp. TaxID=35761 RepID=UPI0027332A3D|nr:FAD-dependent oxidoreductase [Nocardioides sp.]MDP3891261.1 FAD-dependent oxidoreductase [Nocardioides sp.]